MALEFPIDLEPVAISRRKPPTHNVAAFESEAGLRSAVCYGCNGHSTRFTLDFAGMQALEDGQLLKFWMEIKGSSSGSCRAFVIADCHPMWDLVQAHPMWKEHLTRDPLGRAWWIVEDEYEVGGDLCFLLETSLSIRNVYRRA